MKRTLDQSKETDDKPVIGVATDRQGRVTSIPLFSSAEDYAQSCLRTGMEYNAKAAQAYDEANGDPIRSCYMCVWYQCDFDYWTYWRRVEYMERYDEPTDKFYKKHAPKIKELRDAAIKNWDTQTEHLAKCPEPKEGGSKYAKWCAYHNHLFDEAKARAYDVEGNIEDLPEDECYPCVYHKRRALVANMRYTICDLIIKGYYDKLDE